MKKLLWCDVNLCHLQNSHTYALGTHVSKFVTHLLQKSKKDKKITCVNEQQIYDNNDKYSTLSKKVCLSSKCACVCANVYTFRRV